MVAITTATIGFPRIGKNRELKKSLELFWSKKISEAELLKAAHDLEESFWHEQDKHEIDHIGIGDFCLYDNVLDWIVRLGLIPKRFVSLSGLDLYFTLARGKPGVPALDMTKWFDTNYHYEVPEISEEIQPKAHFEAYLDRIKKAKEILGEKAVPIVLGPVTLLKLSRYDGSANLENTLEKVLPLYVELFKQIRALGFTKVNLQEPALVLSEADSLRPQFEKAIGELASVGLPIHLVTFFSDLGSAYTWVVKLPVAGVNLDFTRGDNLSLIKEHGFPSELSLGVGLVDGRSVWKIKPSVVIPLIEKMKELNLNFALTPSSSLQHVPYDLSGETKLHAPLRNVLSGVVQKLAELQFLKKHAVQDQTYKTQEEAIIQDWSVFNEFNKPKTAISEQVKNLTEKDFVRAEPFEERKKKQVPLPLFHTTTIGSFPQTPEIRNLRLKYNKGQITKQEYEAAIDVQIAYAVGLQDGMDIDILVHGEPERTDMVEFFGQKIEGFAFTENGWVQSYGSRCVRPPIIYGDLERTSPMTVREFKVAQSLTKKPVKAMLTGPVTILNWSFPRIDISRKEQCFQIGLALRGEIEDLVKAGALVIQVDEPALREGLPLKQSQWEEYNRWAVDSFRLVCAIAPSSVQTVTHMCYAEFQDVIQSIDDLDADVISIENSRSNDETLRCFANFKYRKDLGPGVYDIHSPVIPETSEIAERIRNFLKHMPADRIVINPDCGLKTRKWNEVIPALQNMVEAAKIVRAEQAKK